MIAAVAAALLAFLCFCRPISSSKATASCGPRFGNNVWAEVDGEVQQVNVEHDPLVKKGRCWSCSESLDLDKEIAEVSGAAC